MPETVDLKHACRLINHGPTVLVSTAHAGRRNVMAAAWSMPVEFMPPRIAVVIDKHTFTWELVQASGTFALNIPCRDQADLAFTVGSESGRDGDKFERHGIASRTGPVLGLPLVDGCLAWMECRRLDEPGTEQRYDTVFAEVVSAQADPRVFRDGRWHVDAASPGLHTLHHLGAGLFATAAPPLQARRLAPRG